MAPQQESLPGGTQRWFFRLVSITCQPLPSKQTIAFESERVFHKFQFVVPVG